MSVAADAHMDVRTQTIGSTFAASCFYFFMFVWCEKHVFKNDNTQGNTDRDRKGRQANEVIYLDLAFGKAAAI